MEAKLHGAGTTSSRATSDTAGVKFVSYNLDNGATSGAPAGLNVDLAMTGALASGGGMAVRSKLTCSDNQANAYGTYTSLNIATDKYISTLGVASRNALHLPNSDITSAAGSLAAVQAEIYSDGASSDAGSADSLAFVRILNAGETSGKNNVDDDAFLLDIQGMTVGAAHLYSSGLTSATVYGNLTEALKIKIGSNTRYIPIATAIS